VKIEKRCIGFRINLHMENCQGNRWFVEDLLSSSATEPYGDYLRVKGQNQHVSTINTAGEPCFLQQSGF
jgi:hypothetical protein